MSRCFRYILLLGAFFACAAAVRQVRAENPVPPPPVMPSESVHTASQSTAKVLGTDQVETAFFQALNLIYSNQFSLASEKFTALIGLASAAGYENLPSYSFVLLERAEQVMKANAKEKEKALFLLRWAEDLSPQDARVAFSIAAFSELLDLRKICSSFWRGVRLSFGEPILAGAIGLNICLVGLVALTLSALLVCLIQIVRNSETIFESFYAVMPPKVKGLVGPIALLALLVIPPFVGVLCSIGVWSLLLSRSLKKCRFLAAGTGALILAWGLAIPVLATGGANMASPLLRAVEALENNSLYPASESVLRRSLGQPGESQVIRFSHAQALALDGSVAAAEAEFRQLLKNLAGNPKLETALKVNLAVLTFRKGQIAEAREQLAKLEAEGNKSFEVYYNLSLVHLAELNTAEQRKYWELAESLDPKRLAHLELVGNEQKFPLMLGVPKLQALPLLVHMDRASTELGGKIWKQQKLLSSSLLSGMTPQLLAVVGAVLLLAGIAGASQQRGRVPFRDQTQSEPFIWHVLPAGSLVSGNAPGKGICVLGIFFAFLIAAYEMPFKPFQILPSERALTSLYVAGAAVTFALGIAASYLYRRRERHAMEQ